MIRLLQTSLLALLLPLAPMAQDLSDPTDPVKYTPTDALTERIYLSGTDKDNTVDWDFMVTGGRRAHEWSKLPVPSHWEFHGFGTYNYGHDKNKGDEKGLYKISFPSSPAWKRKKVFLVFEGSMTDTEAKINGKPAGPVHQGGFYRFKYDVTNLLKPSGSNLLEVTVSKMSANNSVNEAERVADYWIFGGIFRPVYLEIVPPSFIDRVAIKAEADGTFAIDVFASGTKKGQEVEVEVSRSGGGMLGSLLAAPANAGGKTSLQAKFDNVDAWNPEFPLLYEVTARLKSGEEILHESREKFGFRTVEVRKKDGIYVNGVKVLFKGVDRHSFWPASGRALSPEICLKDIQLMKDMNMNAVRMSHYPPDPYFLDMCDSLGLFVIDELAGWQAKYDSEVGAKLVKELVERDVNHPSVVLWANGNEGGFNFELDDDYALYDPQKRQVIHPWERFNGTDTKHYIDFDYLTDASLYSSDILFPTEILHGLYDGGHGAGLDDYWKQMLRHPHGAGMFLWVLADEGIVRTDRSSALDTDGNHGADGILGPYREKEGSFYTIKQIWSPVQVSPQKISATFDGRFLLENLYHWTNLNQCSFRWQTVVYPLPSDSVTQYTILASGSLTPPNILPGEQQWVTLDLPKDWTQADALMLTAYDPYERELFTWTWPLRTPAEVSRELVKTPEMAIAVNETISELEVRAGDIRYAFSKENGQLLRVTTNKGTVSLSGGPVLAGFEHQLTSLKHYAEGASYVVEPQYEGDAPFRLKWVFAPEALPRLDYSYSQKGESDYMGISFSYPEEQVTGMKWMGRGPYRVWKNRMKGPVLGVWQKDYNNTITGESWDYPEFKGYHADLYWVELQTKETNFRVYSGQNNLFLHMLTPERPKGAGNENTTGSFPTGNLSFLHAIAPIGTKFKKVSHLGPQSQPNEMMNYTPYEGSLWFEF